MAETDSTILVVDDQPINIKLLQRKLERSGYQVLVAYNGVEALAVVDKQLPDLILLDVMMPEMDGIETCERLRANPQTAGIPIIFITAKASKEGKVEGLDAGAVDYITKPIDLDETLARVRTQLRLQEMFQQNLELQQRLEESRRTSAVGAITQGIAHNLNNLLGVVVGYIDLIKTSSSNQQMVTRSVGLMDTAIGRMVNIVRQLSTIASKEKIHLSEQALKPLLESSIERFKKENEVECPVEIHLQVPDDFSLQSNTEVFEGVLGKLLINAYESYESKSAQECTIELHVAQAEVKRPSIDIRVLDRGMGIDESVADTLFDPFITTKTSVGRGMGLTVARHSLRNLSAELYLKPREGGGTEAVIRYPV